MRAFRLRNDLQRVVLDGFALPLGLDPGWVDPPREGYTVAYNLGEEDEPDTYAIHVVVSHERLHALLEKAFALLPEQVFGILEVGSRDAYRAVDVYLGGQPITRAQFLEGWRAFEPFLLEDGSIAAGANAEEPFIEIFLDQWKGLYIHLTASMRDDVEQMLADFDLEEVPQTWPISFDEQGNPVPDAANGELDNIVRPVLLIEDEYSPDIDELLLELRHAWQLELNIDPDVNVDDAGRELGRTLWHAVLIVEQDASEPQNGGYLSIWATAASMSQMLHLIERTIDQMDAWRLAEIYTIDRVAYDERPDELADLSPKRDHEEVHLVALDVWGASTDPMSARDETADE